MLNATISGSAQISTPAGDLSEYPITTICHLLPMTYCMIAPSVCIEIERTAE
jgi:hypothetical protein